MATPKIDDKRKSVVVHPVADMSNMTLDDSDEMPGTEAIRIEAEAAVREISFAVNFVELSKVLESTDYIVYINLTTRENENYCVELCLQGFKVRFLRSSFLQYRRPTQSVHIVVPFWFTSFITQLI